MERIDENIFDQLVKEKLSGYSEPPEKAWIKNIHAKKNRIVNLYHLYRLMVLTAIVGLGLFSSVKLLITADMNTVQQTQVHPSQTPQSLLNEQSTTQPLEIVEPIVVNQHTSSFTQTSDNNNLNTSATSTSNNTNSRSKNTPGKVLNLSSKNTVPPHTQQHKNIQVPISTKQQPAKQYQEPQKQTDKTVPTKTTNDSNNTTSNNTTSKKCDASFDYFGSYNDEINFTNTSSIGNKTQVLWNFGDGQTSDEISPSHTFKNSGTYKVTLVVKNTELNCESFYDKTIVYRNAKDNKNVITISGEVFAGNTLVKNSALELYQFNAQKGGFTLVKTLSTTKSGTYSIAINRDVRYLIKAFPNSELQDYTPTFWGNDADMENASEILVMTSENSNLLGYNISLELADKQIAHETPIQPAVITTTEQSIIIIDQNNNIVGVGKVDVNGKVIFDNPVPPGDYTIVNPTTGASTTKTITAGEPLSGDLGSGPKSSETVTVFPNPANDNVNFGVTSNQDEKAILVIMSAGGIEISRREISLTSGFNQAQFDLSSYSPGVYYVMVLRGGQQVLSNRIVKLAGDSNTK